MTATFFGNAFLIQRHRGTERVEVQVEVEEWARRDACPYHLLRALHSGIRLLFTAGKGRGTLRSASPLPLATYPSKQSFFGASPALPTFLHFYNSTRLISSWKAFANFASKNHPSAAEEEILSHEWGEIWYNVGVKSYGKDKDIRYDAP